MVDDLSFSRLGHSDFDGIAALISGMSNQSGLRLRDKTAAYYRWMYFDNPVGPAIVYTAHAGEKIVASFALAPKRFIIDGEELVIGKTMDMFTDPRFQGRGLIKRLTDHVFAAASTAGMPGWYVTPSVNSYPIFRTRWGYGEPFHVNYRAKVLSYTPVLGAALPRIAPVARTVGTITDRLIATFGHHKPRSGGQLARLTHFDGRASDLWLRVAQNHRIVQVRDPAYLNWRYFANPDAYTVVGVERGTDLAGIMVLTGTVRRGVQVAEIVDYLCPPDDRQTFGLLIAFAQDWARANSMALLQAWAIAGTQAEAALVSEGLRIRRTQVKFLLSPGFPGPGSDPNGWFLTQGDGNDV